MALYEKYKKLNIDGSRIGLERGSEIGGYFCTPKGARVIGWDNGIHYCFIRGYGEMVFAVNPETGADKYVYPLAESFEAFLRLILACGHTAPVEQIIMWTEEQFKEFLTSDYNAFMPGQQEVLDTITEKLKLKPMAVPYQYVKQLQAQFDDSKIEFSDEYYDTLGLELPKGRTAKKQKYLSEHIVSFFVTRITEE